MTENNLYLQPLRHTQRYSRLGFTNATAPLSGLFGVSHFAIQPLTGLSVFYYLWSHWTSNLSLRFTYLALRPTLTAKFLIVLRYYTRTHAQTSSTLWYQAIIASCSQGENVIMLATISPWTSTTAFNSYVIYTLLNCQKNVF